MFALIYGVEKERSKCDSNDDKIKYTRKCGNKK